MCLNQFEALDKVLFQQLPVIQTLHISNASLKELESFLPQIRFNSIADFSIDVMRLDTHDPFISGNKWPKMRQWISERIRQGSTRLVSMGGAHSNHLVAFAAACHLLEVKCHCYVRANGDHDNLIETTTLAYLRHFNAEITPVSRSEFRLLRSSPAGDDFLPEGGRSKEALQSIRDWVGIHRALFKSYTSIFTACGTGTWLAGLIAGFAEYRLSPILTGVPAVAGQKWLEADIHNLLEIHFSQNEPKKRAATWALDWSYPVKGFGPVPQDLLNALGQVFRISLDPVYMPRILYSLLQARQQDNFAESTLIIHSGGIQAAGRYIALHEFHLYGLLENMYGLLENQDKKYS